MTTLADSETRGSEAATGWVRTTAYTWSASPVSVGTGHILAPRHRLGAPLYRVDRSGPPNHALSLPRMSRLIHQPLPGCPSLASWAIGWNQRGTISTVRHQRHSHYTTVIGETARAQEENHIQYLLRRTSAPNMHNLIYFFSYRGLWFLTSQGWNG